MDIEVKKYCLKYFEQIGGIESVKPEYRYRIKRAVVGLYTSLYKSNLIEKIKISSPMYPPINYMLGIKNKLEL